MKFMRRTAKYTWQHFKTNGNILSELKINPALTKFTITDMIGGRQTATLNYEISTTQETKPRTNPLKISQLLMGLEHVTRPKTPQSI
jgi:hypothetical protein